MDAGGAEFCSSIEFDARLPRGPCLPESLK
jgi:hypothetical protein